MFEWFDTYILTDTIKVILDKNWTDWIIPVSTALLTLLAVAVAIFKETIISWFYSPKLKVSYKPENPYVTLGFFLKVPAYYYHLEVTNVRKKPCEECFVEISEIYEKIDNKYCKINDFIPTPLKWATTNHETTTIYMGQIKLIDIGFVVAFDKPGIDDWFDSLHAFRINFIDKKIMNGHYWFYNEGESYSNKLHQYITKSGVYRFKTSIYSANTKPRHDWWRIYCSGDFALSIELMNKELNITKSKPPDSI